MELARTSTPGHGIDEADFGPRYRALIERPIGSAAELEAWLLDRSDLDAQASELGADLYIAMTRHTEDAEAQTAYRRFIEEVEPELKRFGFALDQKLAGSPWADELDPIRYQVLLRDVQADVALFREENVALETRDAKLGQDYNQITGAMMVPFQGAEHTLPRMQRFLEVTDRGVREGAWRATAARRLAERERIDGLFDSLVPLRDQMAHNANMRDYQALSFRKKHRFDYAPADCADFHRAAEEGWVPILRDLHRARAATMGLTVLRPWDLAVDPRGRPPLRPFESAEQLVAGCSLIFHRMDAELGSLFDQLRTGDCLDLESRTGKAPGGYQAHRDWSRRPFIFMNAAGLQLDIVILLHEAGHAFHSMLCDTEPLVAYRHTTSEFAEVASMTMELFAHDFLDQFYEPDEARRARREHLEMIVGVIPWIATIDAFQDWIYLHPGHTAAERTEEWHSLMDRFGGEVDWSGLEAERAIRWHSQIHLFCHPYYYIEYGIAQLGALGLWRQFRADRGQALANYKRSLALGGSRPLPDLFEAAGIPFDFSPPAMRDLLTFVRQEIEALAD